MRGGILRELLFEGSCDIRIGEGVSESDIVCGRISGVLMWRVPKGYERMKKLFG